MIAAEQSGTNSNAFQATPKEEWIEEWYTDLERHFEIEACENGELRHLCDPGENLGVPVHSWYNLKEAFSPQFPTWIVDHLGANFGFKINRALDPFCGGGTTLIALSQVGIRAVGVEYNPFIASMARSKSAWQLYDLEEIRRVLEHIEVDVPPRTRISWPQLTTVKQTRYFRRDDVRALLYVVSQISDLECSDLTKQFLHVGIAAAIEDVANLRKDGRALRYVKKPGRPSAQAAMRQHWMRNLDDLKKLHRQDGINRSAESAVWLGSALNLMELHDPWDDEAQSELRASSFDLVLYSPPYLNNFDYSEVYKLELWLLGYLDSYEGWRELRRGTVRSHHSVKFTETSHLASDSVTAQIAEHLLSLGESQRLKGYAANTMPPVIAGYFDDMYLALKEQLRVLEPGGFLVYMVANSCHSNLPIATDVIIGEIARLVGFEPLKLVVLHQRNGRAGEQRFLRESVVIARKPEGREPHVCQSSDRLSRPNVANGEDDVEDIVS
jgi:DNA modification methylase